MTIHPSPSSPRGWRGVFVRSSTLGRAFFAHLFERTRPSRGGNARMPLRIPVFSTLCHVPPGGQIQTAGKHGSRGEILPPDGGPEQIIIGPTGLELRKERTRRRIHHHGSRTVPPPPRGGVEYVPSHDAPKHRTGRIRFRFRSSGKPEVQEGGRIRRARTALAEEYIVLVGVVSPDVVKYGPPERRADDIPAARHPALPAVEVYAPYHAPAPRTPRLSVDADVFPVRGVGTHRASNVVVPNDRPRAPSLPAGRAVRRRISGSQELDGAGVVGGTARVRQYIVLEYVAPGVHRWVRVGPSGVEGIGLEAVPRGAGDAIAMDAGMRRGAEGDAGDVNEIVPQVAEDVVADVYMGRLNVDAAALIFVVVVAEEYHSALPQCIEQASGDGRMRSVVPHRDAVPAQTLEEIARRHGHVCGVVDAYGRVGRLKGRSVPIAIRVEGSVEEGEISHSHIVRVAHLQQPVQFGRYRPLPSKYIFPPRFWTDVQPPLHRVVVIFPLVQYSPIDVDEVEPLIGLDITAERDSSPEPSVLRFASELDGLDGDQLRIDVPLDAPEHVQKGGRPRFGKAAVVRRQVSQRLRRESGGVDPDLPRGRLSRVIGRVSRRPISREQKVLRPPARPPRSWEIVRGGAIRRPGAAF
mmetsp:Transcript_5213/g.15054  ORF Transcript_5213/g.15054 Transcript_5213/m.15054 type:complete len:636 (+) Transcript_5213:208-2115(+)